MTLTPKPHGFELRLRYGKGKRERFLLRCDEPTAKEREPRMEAMARKLAEAGSGGSGSLELLREAAEHAANESHFASVERVVDQLRAEAGKSGSSSPRERILPASGPLTFRGVAELWTSGKLTELYPDHRRLPDKEPKRRAEDKAIVATFFPALDKPLRELTSEDIDAAIRLIPKGIHFNTRRKYRKKLQLVLRIAESPLRLVERAPDVDIPRRQASNISGLLYPQEEALLLAHTAIPLKYRVLYGYLARNGCRITESLQLTWDHIDRETGDIHIDKRWTKTKKARRWVLDSDVLEAFEAYYLWSGSPKGNALVFPGRAGELISHGTVRKRLALDLKAAGVARKAILIGGDGIDPFTTHDFRASFVTLALRAGRDLKWITTRTGHEDLGAMKGYDRLIQDAEEHHLPRWFSPMAQAIPELRGKRQGGPRVGQPTESAAFMGHDPRSQGTAELGETGEESREKATSVTPETSLHPTSGPASFQGVGQTGPSGPPLAEPADPVEQALAYALEEATKDKRYDVVLAVTRELEQRRLARSATNVTSLDSRRKPKGDGK